MVLVSVRERSEKSNEMSTGPQNKKNPNYQTDTLGSIVNQLGGGGRQKGFLKLQFWGEARGKLKSVKVPENSRDCEFLKLNFQDKVSRWKESAGSN